MPRMRLVPDSAGGLKEHNDCHVPSGPDGGQFCDEDGVPRGSTHPALARGLTGPMSATEYAKAHSISTTTARKRLDAMVSAGTARWSMGSHRRTSRFRDVRDHVSRFKVYRPVEK